MTQEGEIVWQGLVNFILSRPFEIVLVDGTDGPLGPTQVAATTIAGATVTFHNGVRPEFGHHNFVNCAIVKRACEQGFRWHFDLFPASRGNIFCYRRRGEIISRLEIRQNRELLFRDDKDAVIWEFKEQDANGVRPLLYALQEDILPNMRPAA